MNRFLIEGGRPLHGDVYVSGMKNSALPILFATVLVRGTSVLENIPKITDISGALLILEKMGARVEWLSLPARSGARPRRTDEDRRSRWMRLRFPTDRPTHSVL